MRRTPKSKSQKQLLVSVEKIRTLEPDKLRDVVGGACPMSKPVIAP